MWAWLAGPLKWIAGYILQKIWVALRDYFVALAERLKRNRKVDDAIDGVERAKTPEEQEDEFKDVRDAGRNP